MLRRVSLFSSSYSIGIPITAKSFSSFFHVTTYSLSSRFSMEQAHSPNFSRYSVSQLPSLKMTFDKFNWFSSNLYFLFRAAYSKKSYTGEGCKRRILSSNKGIPICSTTPMGSVRKQTCRPSFDISLYVCSGINESIGNCRFNIWTAFFSLSAL